jgi:hypothetical protein
VGPSHEDARDQMTIPSRSKMRLSLASTASQVSPRGSCPT